MRNLAFFLLGLLVSMALGIASAHADTTYSTCDPANLSGGVCASPVWVTGPDMASIQTVVQQQQTFLEQIFALPAATDLGQAWFIGFGLPVTLFLIARMVGAVIKTLR